MKLVLVEPNLKTTAGHVFEATRALDNYLFGLEDIQQVVVSHQDITSQTKAYFKTILPIATQTCFESTNYEGVFDYLKQIISALKLTEEDLILFTTAHFNEIQAAVQLATNHTGLPQIILQVHQYYPPTTYTDQVFAIENEDFLLARFKEIGNKLSVLGRRVQVITTPVHMLSQKLTEAMGLNVPPFPVAFAPPPLLGVDSKTELKHIGYLGDGRKEKGLINFLAFAEIQELAQYDFHIQLQNVRGMTLEQQAEYERVKAVLAKRENVHFIEGSLNSQEYYQFFSEMELLVLPYEPSHYQARMSGIAAEAGMLGIPILVSSDTSMAGWVNTGILTGETFDYAEDALTTKLNMISAIKRISTNYKELSSLASARITETRRKFSAENFLQNHILPLSK